MGIAFLGTITFLFAISFFNQIDFKSPLYGLYGSNLTTGYIDHISLHERSFLDQIPTQELHYYYQVGEDVFEGRSYVNPKYVYYKGKTTIEYVNTMEFVSRVEGASNEVYPLFALVFLSICPLLTIIIFYKNRHRVQRIGNALKSGGFAKAELQGKKIVDDTEKKEVYALAYYYEVNGNKNTLFFQTEDPELFSKTETLIYPINDPGNTVMLNELPDPLIKKIIKKIKNNQ